MSIVQRRYSALEELLSGRSRGAPSSVATSGSATATTLSGMWRDTRVRFLRFNDQVYQFNGRNSMRAFDGAGWRLAGIVSGNGAPTAAAQAPASAGITGTYVYYITAANTRVTVGDSRYVESVPIAIGGVSPTAQDVLISNIPAVHTDPQVNAWILYRNKDGYLDVSQEDDVQDFFKVAEIPIGTTSYLDDTPDDDLPPFPVLNFKAELPPAFKYGEVYANLFFGCGFDEYTDGTATVHSNSQYINFSHELPDGVLGCTFRKIGDNTIYTIEEIFSDYRVKLNTNFVGSLSADDFVIYRDPSYLYYSEFDNPECWGKQGELLRNFIPVGGRGSKLRLTGLKAAHGVLYVFTLDQVYRVYGKAGSISLAPDPILNGIGCVSGDTIKQVDDTLYWLSLEGPVAYNPNKSENQALRIGTPLGPNWLDDLNPLQLGLSAAGYSPKRHTLKFACPLSSEDFNGKVFVYDLRTETWWPETYWNPTLYWEDYDSNGQIRCYSANGRRFYLEDQGHIDGVPSGTTTGAITGYASQVITCSAASFYITGYGLEKLWAHVFNGADYVGSSRITSNTATTITLEDDIASTAAGYTVYVGSVMFKWQTKTFVSPEAMHRLVEFKAKLALQADTTALVYHRGVHNGTEQLSWLSFTANENAKRLMQVARGEVSCKLEIRTPNAQVAFRSMVLEKDDDGRAST